MIDIETTGLDPFKNNITSIACIPFNFEYKAWNMPDAFIKRIPTKMRNGEDDIATMDFRSKYCIDEIEDKFTILGSKLDLYGYISDYEYIWAKPTTFDLAFLQKFFDGIIPWHHRNTRDVYTYISGFRKDPAAYCNKRPFNGTLHNPVNDALHQVNCLFECNSHPSIQKI